MILGHLMLIVYSLQSASDPERYYIGITDDLNRRLDYHNKGKCLHTSKYKPWQVLVSISFVDERKTRGF